MPQSIVLILGAKDRDFDHRIPARDSASLRFTPVLPVRGYGASSYQL
jgi:hypothetical protein